MAGRDGERPFGNESVSGELIDQTLEGDLSAYPSVPCWVELQGD